ncbi:MAG: maleylpyruvate isomerase N-terminal domain-containing protein [Actinomycetota bacterium]
MSHDAIVALHRIHEHAEQVFGALADEDWGRASACEGWRMQDVLAHMSSTMHQAVVPDAVPAPPEGSGAEDQVAAMVSIRTDWSVDRLLDEYHQYCEPWLAGLDAMQEEPIASTVTPLADLGEYPLHLLANAFVFDHYCHLWIDMLGVEDPPMDPPVAEHAVVRPGIDWMIAGLPRMQPDEMRRTVTAPMRLDLTGAGFGRWTILPAAGDELVSVIDGEEVEPIATITSSAHDFVRWGTKRDDWRSACEVRGDATVATPFLDALNII